MHFDFYTMFYQGKLFESYDDQTIKLASFSTDVVNNHDFELFGFLRNEVPLEGFSSVRLDMKEVFDR